MFKKLLTTSLVLFLLIAVFGGGLAYYFLLKPNTTINYGSPIEVFIPSNANFETVVNLLFQKNIILNKNTFIQVAKTMNYPNKIYPGRYFIKPNSNNREIVTLLRSGEQTPYKLIINNIRTKEELLHLADSVIEPNYEALATLLNNTSYLQQYGFTSDNVTSMFMADTYEINWNTSPEHFFERMYKEYNKFWTEDKKQQAKQQHLSPFEIIILASIVEGETVKADEMPRIAGLYLNRLRKFMPLQADPTVKFAMKDFTLKRIYKKYTEIDSPYNTYKYAGLPPGPISIPSKKAITACLNAEQHNYLYMCAKEDFSGYHNFASSYEDHQLFARKYQKALDENLGR